jgi:hypothetical protein
VDLELRYHAVENKIDIGVFSPAEMLSVDGAEGIIGEFMGFWA